MAYTKPAAIAEPICTIGPSRPAEPPEPMVSAAADRLVDGVLAAASRTAISVLVDGIRNPDERAATAVYLVAASPEFQLI